MILKEVKPSDNLQINYDTGMATCRDCGNVAWTLPHFCTTNVFEDLPFESKVFRMFE